MVRVITLLSLWQLKNALRSTFTDYRKLIPLVVIVLFVGVQVLSTVLLAGSRPSRLPEALSGAVESQIDMIRVAAFLVLAMITVGIIDYGFAEGFLAFSLADVDYLFPSPIPRRLILAYRLGAKTLTSFFQAALLFYFLVWRLLESMAHGRASFAAALPAFGNLLCCLGGYASVAFTLKMVFGFGRLATIRRWILALFGVLALLLAYSYWQGGLEALTSVTRNGVVVAAFYPCSLAAEALTAPLVGTIAWGAFAQLIVFYAGATALLFSRNENFYEASLEGSERTARMLQAAKDQNWSAMFTIQGEGKRKSGRKPYALPPFGSGAAALLWANLAAAAKRPFANFWAPLLGGIGIAIISTVSLPGNVSAFVVGGVSVYLLFLMTMSGMSLYRQSVARQPLIRPLPLPDWQVVLADILPRCLLLSLFTLGAGAVHAFLARETRRHRGRAASILCVPAALVALNLLQFMLALWYPDAQDKFQQLIAGFVSLFLTMTVVSLMAIGLVVPLLLGAPGWLTALIFLIPALIATGILLYWASAVYRRFQPKQ